MAQAKTVEVPKIGPSAVVEFDEAQTEALGKRERQVKPSPLIAALEAAIADGKGKGVGVGEDYPKSTALAHISKAAKQLKLSDKGLKVRTFDRSSDKDWPHVGFKIVKIEAKVEEPAK